MDKKRTSFKRINRRGFLRHSMVAAAGMGLAGRSVLSKAESTSGSDDALVKEYRVLGRTGFKVSDIGFGAGYLTDSSVLEKALDSGINYLDTAEHYARGNSERTIGQVIKNRDRKKIFITSKLNFMMGKSTKDGLRERFNRCLQRLETDYVDCLMIHMTPNMDQVRHEPYHELIRELKAEGKVRFSGLSNHGTGHVLAGMTKDNCDKVIGAAAEDGRFDVALFTYNFMQRGMGDRVLASCKAKNMGTTLMKINPVRSYNEIKAIFDRTIARGREIPESTQKVLDVYRQRSELAENFIKKYKSSGGDPALAASVRFCLSNPDVHTICPSITTFEHLDAYLPLSGTRLEPVETELLSHYKKVFDPFYCRHGCGECESACPRDVPVNTVMRYNHYFLAQGREKHALEHYSALGRNKASSCSSCSGPCEKACPFGVPVRGLLAMAHELLTLS